MIYLQNIARIQAVYIPCEKRDIHGEITLDVVGTINHQSIRCKATIDKSHMQYCRVYIQLPESISAGEYEYTMSDDMGVLSTGLLMIRESEASIEYNEVTEYEQYTE